MAPPNPLLQYDSPRRAYSSDEYTETQSTVTLTGKGIALTSNLLLGPGIVIEEAPAAPGSGQVPYTKLSVSASILALVARVAALEAQRLTLTAPKSADYTAASWEHVLVNLVAAAGDVTITMPASPAINDRVRVTDVSATAGVGAGKRLLVAASFAPGHYAVSPYSVGDIGAGESIIGANAELVYAADGWRVVAETVEPEQLA